MSIPTGLPHAVSVFKLQLVETSLAGVYEIETDTASVSLLKAVTQGLVPLSIRDDKPLATYLEGKINAHTHYPTGVSPADAEAITACGKITRPLQNQIGNLSHLRLFDPALTFREIVELSKSRLGSVWDNSRARRLYYRKYDVPAYEAFNTARARLKAVRGVTLRNAHELSVFPYDKYFCPEDFYDDSAGIVCQGWSGLVLRSLGLFEHLVTEEGHLKVFKCITSFSTTIRGYLYAVTYRPVSNKFRFIPGNSVVPPERLVAADDYDRGAFTLKAEELHQANTTGFDVLLSADSTQEPYLRTIAGKCTVDFPPLLQESSLLDLKTIYMPFSSQSDLAALENICRNAGVPHSGTKEKKTERLAEAIVQHMKWREPAFDDEFSTPWIHIAGSTHGATTLRATGKFGILDPDQVLDLPALYLYILLHLKGGHVLHKDNLNTLIDPYDVALAMINKAGLRLNYFTRVD